jgi:peptidoglycan/xylan/chitin deacetylase (PgdA/CDA1 family)
MRAMSALLHRPPAWRPLLQPGLWRLPRRLAWLGGSGRVLLTFDDGPGRATAEAARLLEAAGARALFFLVAGRLPEDPARPATADEEQALAITRALLAAGHLPAVHGLTHRRLGLLPPAVVRRDLARAAGRLAAACGLPPIFQRPPYGNWTPWLSRVSRRLGLEPVFWSLNPADYRAPRPDALVSRVLELARPGDILLLHCSGPGQESTRAALPAILAGLRGKGLSPLDPMALLEDAHA